MIRNQTKTYLNTCDLYIEEVKMSTTGYFYIVWKRGKRIAQTLKYQSEGKTTPIKQNLTLNIPLNIRNGRNIQKNTVLYILNAEGEQIDQISLQIHRWNSEFSRIQLPLVKGTLIAKVRRKQMMQIKVQVNSQDQQDDEPDQFHMDTLIQSETLTKNKMFYDSYKDEIGRMRKQLQDTLYYNNKLKNDRTVLLSKNLELEAELSMLKKTIQQQFILLDKHYQNKIEIRQTIYEEQIQSLVMTFNSNYEYHMTVLKNLINQQTLKEEEILKYKNKFETNYQQLQLYIQKFSGLQKESNQLQLSLQKQIKLSNNLESQKKQLQAQLQQHKTDIHIKIQLIQQFNAKIKQLESTRLLKQTQIQQKNNSIQKLRQQCQNYKEKIQDLTYESQLNKNELDFTENAYNQQKQANDKNIQRYQQQIRNLQALLQDSQLRNQSKSQILSNQLQSIQKQNQQLKSEIRTLRKINEQLSYEKSSFENKLQTTQSQLNAQRQAIEQLKNSQFQELQIIQNQKSKEAQLIQKQSQMVEKKLLQQKQNQIIQLNEHINRLQEEINFINQNTIKIQDHQKLIDRVKELEKVINQFEQNDRNNSEIEDSNARKKLEHIAEEEEYENNQEKAKEITLQNLQNEYIFHSNNIEEVISKAKSLQEQLKAIKNKNQSLVKEKQTLLIEKEQMKRDFKLLTVQMAQRYAKQMQSVKVVQKEYCVSEEEENRKLEEEMEELQKQALQLKKSNMQSQNGTVNEQPHKKRLKKALSMQIPAHKKLSRDFSESPQIVEEDAESSFGNEDKKRNKFSPEKKKSSDIASKLSLKIDQEVSIVGLGSEKQQIKDQFDKKQDRQDGGVSYSKSRGSHRSGTTFYKYQRVSHSQKIAGLQQDVKQYEKKEADWKQLHQHFIQIQNNLRMQIKNLKTALDIKQQDVSDLKRSLNFEIKKKEQMRAQSTQTSIEKQSKKVEVDIPDPQKILIEKDWKQLKATHENSCHNFQKHIKQLELSIKYLKEKQQELQKYSDNMMMSNEARQKDIEKLKQKLDEDQRAHKQAVQDLKIQKSQIEFQLSTYQSDNKRLKSRIQDLEDKMKKNDVMDLYKQAQFEADNANKKIIEMNRNIYQLRLQKDGFQDEIKIIQKKLSDGNRKLTQEQDHVQRLEKVIEDYKKKQLKLKRQLEDKQDSCLRMKDQIKALNEEINHLKNFQSQQILERKKNIDDLVNAQHSIERKEYENNTLKKQIQKLKASLNQKEEEQTNNRAAHRKQAQKLEHALVKKDKQIIQLESNIKYLTNKLDMQYNENRKNIGEKSTLYSEKLKVYVEEIAHIKKVLEENNYQINTLKEELNLVLGELEATNSKYNKMEQKYNQQSANNQRIFFSYEQQKNQNSKIKQTNEELKMELQNTKNMLKLTKLDLDKTKKEGIIYQQKVEQLEKNNEAQLDLLNKYKIKISDFETNYQIHKNFGDKLEQSEKNNQNLLRELRDVKYTYEDYKAKFIYTNQDLYNAVKKEEGKWKQKNEEEVYQLKIQFTNSNASQKKKFESEIVDLMNESSRLRGQAQKKSEIISQLEHQLLRLETMPLKLQQTELLYKNKEKQCNKYRQIASSSQSISDKLISLQEANKKICQERDTLKEQLNCAKTKNKELQQLKDQSQRVIKNKEAELTDQIGKTTEALKIQNNYKVQIQRLLELIKETQKEKESIFQKLEQSRLEYSNKIKGLQEKLEAMGSAVQQHEYTLQSHFDANLQQIKAQLMNMSEQLRQKNNMILNLQEDIQKSEQMVKQYHNELQRTKEKQIADTDLFEIEITKLKNRMVEMQKMYKTNIFQIETQLEEKSKELTILKMRDISRSQLQYGDSMKESNMNIQRFQEKIKSKDEKIAELKNNIFIYQETIVKLKKSFTQFQHQSEELKKAKKSNQGLYKQIQQLQGQLQGLRGKDRIFKQELQQYKEKIDEAESFVEQKNLELSSVQFQLATTKKLYTELQSQLDKRKLTYGEHSQESKHLEQLQSAKQSISQFLSKLNELQAQSLQMQTQLSKKNQTIANLQKKIVSLEKSQGILKVTLSTKSNEESKNHLNQIKRLTEQNEILRKDLKRVRQQNQRLQKDNWDYSLKISANQNSVENLNMTIDSLTQKCNELQNEAQKYNYTNEICYKILSISLDEAFLQNGITRKLDQKQFELSNMVEEIQELKFLSERNFMDYDQLKKQNYQLQLQLQESQFANEQIEQLRQICDKLEQQKKEALFREQYLMMQIENIIKSSHGETKKRMLNLLNSSQLR